MAAATVGLGNDVVPSSLIIHHALYMPGYCMHEMIGIESTLSLFNGAQPHVVHVVMHWSQRGYRDTSTLAFDQKRASTSVHVQTLDINFEVL